MRKNLKNYKYKTIIDRSRNYQMVAHDGGRHFWFYYISPRLLKKYKEFYTNEKFKETKYFIEYGEKAFFKLFCDSLSMLMYRKTGKIEPIVLGGDYVCLKSIMFYAHMMNDIKPIHKKYINDQIKLINIRYNYVRVK